MRSILLAASLFVLAVPPSAFAQKMKSEEDFAKAKPAVGETIPDVTVYDPSGKEVKTSALRGHYTVLTFCCLT
jgi:cytochrome oxidase Cu insertion factor (SCO1/SenC/PrrC family)